MGWSERKYMLKLFHAYFRKVCVVLAILVGGYVVGGERNSIQAKAIGAQDAPIGTFIKLGETLFVKVNSEGLFVSTQSYSYPTCTTAPTITNSSPNLCEGAGSSSLLVASSPLRYATCTWTPTTGLSDPTSCTPTATPTETTTYTVSIKGCPSPSSTTVTVAVCTPTTMQNMTADYCNSMSNLDTLTLTDTRDSKTYRVRKFADGHCWMIDNLAYGGTTEANGTIDACATKVTFSGNGQTTPYTAWYSGSQQLYGDCRNNPSSNTYGYLYNWQAAMQQSLAYYTSKYTGSAGNNGAGICPTGWLLPPNAGDGSFYNLHTTYSSPTSPNFWANTTHWNGVYSGYSNNNGTLNDQAVNANYWSSTQYATDRGGYNLSFGTAGYVIPQSNLNKFYGLSVRCVF